MRRRLRSTLLAEIAAKTSRPATLDVASDNRDRTSSLDAIFGGTRAFAKMMRGDVGRLNRDTFRDRRLVGGRTRRLCF